MEQLNIKIPINKVLPFVNGDRKNKRGKKFHKFYGKLINVTSTRLRIFKIRGVKCVDCGIEGKYFKFERHPDTEKYHLALYGINSYGHEILMTKDHIFPKSKIEKGKVGRNALKNLRPLCYKCNQIKGDKLPNNIRGMYE